MPRKLQNGVFLVVKKKLSDDITWKHVPEAEKPMIHDALGKEFACLNEEFVHCE